MLKSLLMSVLCALAMGSAAAGPIKPGETPANPFMLTVGAHIDVKWDPPNANMWVWAELEKFAQLYVAVASTTAFDFGLAPPNNGNVQDFEFKLYINGNLQSDVGAPGLVAFYDDIVLNAGTVYTFTLQAFNAHSNAANTDIQLLAGGADDEEEEPNPGNEVPEPASLALLGSGLLGLGMARRRRSA